MTASERIVVSRLLAGALAVEDFELQAHDAATPLPVKCSFVCSQAEGISPGDLVVGPTGWQRHALLTAREARVVASGLDPAHHLGVLNNRVRMEGFLVFDYSKRYEQARARI